MKLITKICRQKIKKYFGLGAEIDAGLILGTENLNLYLSAIEHNKRTQIFMGRGPSKAPHLAHIITWRVGKKIQIATKSDLIFQLSDDEKYYETPKISLVQAIQAGKIYPVIISNMGFIPEKTHIFSNIDNMEYMYALAAKKLAKHVKLGALCALFGYTSGSSIGSVFYGLVEIAVCMSGKDAPILVVTGPDQEPFFKLYNQLAKKINLPEVSVLYLREIKDIMGVDKMSSRGNESRNISLGDSDDVIKKKFLRAISGAKIKLPEHVLYGIDKEKDWCYNISQYLQIPKIVKRGQLYARGKIRSDTFKNQLSICVIEYFKKLLRPNQLIKKSNIRDYFESLKVKRCTVLGIDQAGKGALLGSMFVAGLSWSGAIEKFDNFQNAMRKIGVRDSKRVKSPIKRADLTAKILKHPNVKSTVLKIPPKKIDSAIAGKNTTLNTLLNSCYLKLIDLHNPTHVVLDCPVNDTVGYHSKMKIARPGIKYTIKNRADETYAIVGAASIIAKSGRDLDIKDYPEAGSGYPSDRKTVAYVKKNPQSKHIRKTWKTSF